MFHKLYTWVALRNRNVWLSGCRNLRVTAATTTWTTWRSTWGKRPCDPWGRPSCLPHRCPKGKIGVFQISMKKKKNNSFTFDVCHQLGSALECTKLLNLESLCFPFYRLGTFKVCVLIRTMICQCIIQTVPNSCVLLFYKRWAGGCWFEFGKFQMLFFPPSSLQFHLRSSCMSSDCLWCAWTTGNGVWRKTNIEWHTVTVAFY